MSTQNVNVDWHKPEETPPYIGQYFVAVKYKNSYGLGSYDLMEWDGEKWVIDYPVTVVGWVTLQDFMNAIKAGWPEWERISDELNP
ncbi:hypothetical protein [Hahella ganghwensis]|uniref:hypothetical protein n=1 Tax=Hahella ganghwensis TaxID=286420 RepID=UPI00035D741F|nr:hypothetical protein [Hahella ganghwensis]